jgi:DNA-directed RNA polymerase subunit RPC12/RpoP
MHTQLNLFAPYGDTRTRQPELFGPLTATTGISCECGGRLLDTGDYHACERCGGRLIPAVCVEPSGESQLFQDEVYDDEN